MEHEKRKYDDRGVRTKKIMGVSRIKVVLIVSRVLTCLRRGRRAGALTRRQTFSQNF